MQVHGQFVRGMKGEDRAWSEATEGFGSIHYSPPFHPQCSIHDKRTPFPFVIVANLTIVPRSAGRIEIGKALNV
jgi:hypothetical protein